MTSQFRKVAHCPNCGYDVPLEDDFSQWLRGEPLLDSAHGFVFTDKDIVCHRYKTSHGREFQLFMFVEVKIKADLLRDSQRDTLIMIDQMFRNDRSTPTKRARLHGHFVTERVWSTSQKRWIVPRSLGYHLLRISGFDPPSSAIMRWDKRPENITVPTLISLLRFDLHPDTLEPLDFRIHHTQKSAKKLPGFES